MIERKRNNRFQKGFSVISIVLTILLILILITFTLPSVICSCDNSFKDGAKAKISQYSSQLALYQLDNGAFPSTEEGLSALVNNVSGKESWRQLLKTVDKDPWGNEYEYRFPGIMNPSLFDVWSYGADGVESGTGNNADIGNWASEE